MEKGDGKIFIEDINYIDGHIFIKDLKVPNLALGI